MRVSHGEHSWNRETERFQNDLPLDRRKQDGIWFTPLDLALPTARQALAPLSAASTDKALRICDPAVGAGSFLLAAAKVLKESQTNTRASYTGLDLDADAAKLASDALREHQNDGIAIRTGDGLIDLEPESFDCVLTNPPWETLQEGKHAKERVADLRPRFQHQGNGKLYTYRLFIERAVQLLRPGGRLGLIAPASLWFDRDAEPLRSLLLDSCEWQWLFGFENRERIFAIDSRYRFGAIIATKGGCTSKVMVAFGRSDVADWDVEFPDHLVYERSEIRRLSPHAGTFVEAETRRDLDILTRMQTNGCKMIGDEGAFCWRQGDFNMTADRSQFVLREEAERVGYRPNSQGIWQHQGQEDLLPLRQGAMIYDLRVNAAAHASGMGHKTKWRAPSHDDELAPLYLVAAESWRATASTRSAARIGLRALSNATNKRTAIACLLPDVPCGNSIGVLMPREEGPNPLLLLAAGTAMLSSLSFDWALRMRLGGTNLNRFILTDCMLPQVDSDTETELAQLALRMCATTPWTKELWNRANLEGWCSELAPITQASERRRAATRIDQLVGQSFGLSPEDIAWMTRGQPFIKGFWRIERELPQAQRRPNRWLKAATAIDT
jgi:hypothetical protein